jgi:N-acetylglucosamine-6-phosphate deacetylase
VFFMNNTKLSILSKRIVTPLVEIRDGIILIEGEKIVAVGLQQNIPIPDGYRKIDLDEKIVAPGFIDLHNHGGLGKIVDEGGAETVRLNSSRLVETGCTGWLPTVNSLYGVKEIVKVIKEGIIGTEVAGIHMEGPFLTPKGIAGIQGIDSGLENPSLERLYEFLEAAEGHLKIMGLSVELEGADAIIQELRKLGVLPAIAHSTRATYEQFLRSVELGIRHVTHTYNVMTPLHQRLPGVLGGALTCEQVTNEIISDGFHVSPVAIDILVRCKGTDKICVITDNTSVAGLPDGEFEYKGSTLIKKDGITRYANSTSANDHTMAGSEWPINHNVRTLIEKVHLKLADAVKMASLNPARMIGLDHRIGSLEPGKDANLIAVDERMNVYLTLVKGQLRYDPTGLMSSTTE